MSYFTTPTNPIGFPEKPHQFIEDQNSDLAIYSLFFTSRPSHVVTQTTHCRLAIICVIALAKHYPTAEPMEGSHKAIPQKRKRPTADEGEQDVAVQMALPPHLQQAVNANQARMNQQLREENRELNEESRQAKNANEGTLRAVVQQKFGGYTDQMRQIKEQLAAKDAQLKDTAAELEGLFDQNAKLRLQVQVKDDQMNKQAEKMAQQFSDLKGLISKNQDQVHLIQQFEDTVTQQADELERENATIQQLVHDKSSLRSDNERLRDLFNEEVLGRLSQTLATIVSPKSTTNDRSNSQTDCADSALFTMAQFHQVMARIDSMEQNYNEVKSRYTRLERKCSALKDPEDEQA
ncbi:hypothetical protein PG997_003491 [Apiospora hydei]|uniref:Uncharacterized protein n=1 Tax=Apiospora hydei TaxID=1337664 RepID=A0ABR1WZG8_9PEZI